MNNFLKLTCKKLIIAYTTLFILSIIWLNYNLDNFCPKQSLAHDNIPADDNKATSHYEEEWKLLQERSRDLALFEKQLKFKELEMRRRFPDQIESLLDYFESSQQVIYAITPTYARPVQKAELTRLINTFINVPNFHWIVVEDAVSTSHLVAKLLHGSGLKYTHLFEPTPQDQKLQPTDPNWLKPRGVQQRNRGLTWIRDNLWEEKTGVVYFADDDNTYDLKLFEEMRTTNVVSVWPVGLVGYLRYERPTVENHKVTGWFTYWMPDRSFAMDMAGFSISLELILKFPKGIFSSVVKRGGMESDFLTKFDITLDDLEPKAEDCTKVLVWHTRTEKPSLKNEAKLKAKGLAGSDTNVEV